MATLPELEMVLLSFYGKMLPLGGIVSKANRGICQLDQGFYGAGFPYPEVKATASQANKLLMHYGCHVSLGTELQTSLELLVADLGLLSQPFQVNYEQYGLLQICPDSEQSFIILPSRGQQLADS
jgi:hypothetical protein